MSRQAVAVPESHAAGSTMCASTTATQQSESNMFFLGASRLWPVLWSAAAALWPDEGPGDSQQRPYEPGRMNDDEHLQVFLQSVSRLTDGEREQRELEQWGVRPLVASLWDHWVSQYSRARTGPSQLRLFSCNSLFVCCCCCFVTMSPAEHHQHATHIPFCQTIQTFQLNLKPKSLRSFKI